MHVRKQSYAEDSDCGGLTTSCLGYSLGSTSRAFAVGTSKLGMTATALISFAQGNLIWCPIPKGGSGGRSPVSIPPAGAGNTSLSGISTRATSWGASGFRYVPTKPPKRAAPTLSGCRSRQQSSVLVLASGQMRSEVRPYLSLSRSQINDYHRDGGDRPPASRASHRPRQPRLMILSHALGGWGSRCARVFRQERHVGRGIVGRIMQPA
jgi:hypothetical protein